MTYLLLLALLSGTVEQVLSKVFLRLEGLGLESLGQSFREHQRDVRLTDVINALVRRLKNGLDPGKIACGGLGHLKQ